MRLARGAVRHPVAVLFFTLAVLLGGFMAHQAIEVETFPEFKMAEVRIVTGYPGAGPHELEALVTVPVETRVKSVKDVREISSTTREGSSVVSVAFKEGVDLDVAVADIKTALQEVASRLPDEATDPVVVPVAMGDLPVVILSVTGPRSANELKLVAERVLREPLLKIPGVGDVEVHGGTEPYVLVEVDQERLRQFGLTTDDLTLAIRRANLNMPGGRVRLGGGRYLVRTVGAFTDVEDIAGVPVDLRRHPPVLVRDVARVSRSFYPNENVSRVNGRPNVMLQVKKAYRANVVTVAKACLARIESLRPDLPEGVDVVVLYDLSAFVEDQLSQVETSAVIGGLLAMLVLYAFLRRIATTAIIAVSIPMSILMTLVVMLAAGETINYMSLAGMLLALGMLVDDSIVVLENVVRHVEAGGTPERAAVRGASEIASAVLASTVTTVIVFAPVFLLGDWGPATLLKVMCFSLVVAVCSSYVVAMTVVPTACSLFVRAGDVDAVDRKSGRGVRGYRSVLRCLLRHPVLTLGFTGLALVLSTLWVASLGFVGNFTLESKSVPLYLSFPPDAGRERMESAFAHFEGLFRRFPEVQNLQAWTNEARGDGTLMANLGIRGDARVVERIKREIRPRLGDLPGVTASFQGMQAMMGTSPIEVMVRGRDYEALARTAREVEARLKGQPMLVNVQSNLQGRKRELHVTVDRSRAAARGVAEGDVASAVRVAVFGVVATRVIREGREVDVLVRLREDQGGRVEALDDLLVPSRRGGAIPLREVASVEWRAAVPEITRRDFKQEVRVGADVDDPRRLGEAGAVARKALEGFKPPAGVSLDFGGVAKEEAEGRTKLLLVFLFAVFLVYAVMAVQFESFLQPLVIMASLPLALIGCNLALAATGTPFGVMSAIGVILLAGVVVNDAIVLVDYVNQVRASGTSRLRAIMTAGQVRLRPIVMTSLTTIFGIVPMALGIGQGAEVYVPLGVSLIGGLGFATVLTLGIIPLAYVLVEDVVGWFGSAARRLGRLVGLEGRSA